MLPGFAQFFEQEQAAPSIPTARDYVQNGLVAMWDGIENAGWGVHDANATVWKDLVGTRDLTVNATGQWLSNALETTGQLAAVGNSFLTENILTAEIILKTETSGMAAKWKTNYNNINRYCYASETGYSFEDLNVAGVVAVPISVNVLSVVYRATGRNISQVYVNGNEETRSSTEKSDLSATGCPAIGVKATGEYYGVRLYSLQLTAEEIAANYAIDKARFNLP